jgi:hypothetical protein
MTHQYTKTWAVSHNLTGQRFNFLVRVGDTHSRQTNDSFGRQKKTGALDLGMQ